MLKRIPSRLATSLVCWALIMGPAGVSGVHAQAPSPAGRQAPRAPQAPSRQQVIDGITRSTGGRSDLTVEETRASGQAMLQVGRPDMARDVAHALLVRDPRDLSALLLLSQAERSLGQNAPAIDAATRAWDVAATPEERYAAAMVRAQALSSAGHRTRAQLWLRRATEEAPDARTRARAIRDFKYVRLRNPWSTQLRFAVTPTDNVNNGSAEDTFTIDGLPFEFILSGSAKALSGVELSFGADTRYRLAETPRRATDLLLRVSHSTYVLSDDAQDAAPEAEGRDFATSSLAAGLSRRIMFGDKKNELVLTGWVGQNWYGGDPYGHFLRAGARFSHSIDPRNRLTTGLTLEARRGDDAPEADVGLLSLSWDHAWTGGQLSVYGVATRSVSDSVTADYRDLRLGARLAPDMDWLEAALGADPAFTLEARTRDFDASPYTFDGRRDEELMAGVEVVFRDIDYYGFNPVMTLESSVTSSNVSLNESDRTGLGLSIRSAF